MGSAAYEHWRKHFPELFTTEAKFEEAYSKVPQKVHDAYEAEIDKKLSWYSSKFNQGIMYYIAHTKEVQAIQEESERLFGTYTSIWNKHYSIYGLTKE